MLVLCSNGLSSCRLLERVRRKAAGCHTAALVVTADNVYKERNYHVPRCLSELRALNLAVDIVDLDRQPAESLLDYDVVEFIGGNPYDLLHVLRQGCAADTLRRIAGERILIGWSAAAFVFSPTLGLVNRYSPEMNFPGLTDLSGLALTDAQVLPHYSKMRKRFEGFEEICRAYEAERGVQVIRIDDGEGVLIDGGAIDICRA